MGARGETGVAVEADGLPFFDHLPSLDFDGREVVVGAVDAKTVVEIHSVSPYFQRLGKLHAAEITRHDRQPLGEGDVRSTMMAAPSLS